MKNFLLSNEKHSSREADILSTHLLTISCIIVKTCQWRMSNYSSRTYFKILQFVQSRVNN